MIKSRPIILFAFLMISGSLSSQPGEEIAQAICESVRSKLEPLALNGQFQKKLKDYKKSSGSNEEDKDVFLALMQAADEEAQLYRLCAAFEPEGQKKQVLEDIFIKIKCVLAQLEHEESLSYVTRYYLDKGEFMKAQDFCGLLLKLNQDSISGNWCMGRIMENANQEDFAFSLFDHAAQKGDVQSQYRLGKKLCEKGKSEASRRKGLTYLQKAAEQEGPVGAQAKTYLWKYLSELSQQKKDQEMALSAYAYLQKAANGKYPDPEAQLSLGKHLCFIKKGHTNQGEALLQKAVQSGSLDALFCLKDFYLKQSLSAMDTASRDLFMAKTVEQLQKIIQKSSTSLQKRSEAYAELNALKSESFARGRVCVAESKLFWDEYQEKKDRRHLKNAISSIEGLQDPECSFLMAKYLEEQGHSVRAFEEFLKADELGFAAASHRLGVIYRDGLLGQTKNTDKAWGYFRKAAHRGYIESYLSMAYMELLREASEKKANLAKEATQLFLFEFDGLPGSIGGSGHMDSDGVETSIQTPRDNPEIFENFLKAAQLGNAHAQAKVGYHYAFKAKHAKRKDKSRDAFFWQDKAFSWLEKAAAQKERLGLFNLGNHYRQGLGCQKNLKKALECYLEAAAGQETLIGFNKGVALLACQSVGALLEEGVNASEAAKARAFLTQLNLADSGKPSRPQIALAAFYYQRCLDGIKPFYTLESSGERMCIMGMASLPPHLQQAGTRSAAALGHMYFHKSIGIQEEHERKATRERAKEFYETAMRLSTGDPALQEEIREVELNRDILNQLLDAARVSSPKETGDKGLFLAYRRESSDAPSLGSSQNSEGSGEVVAGDTDSFGSGDGGFRASTPRLTKTSTFTKLRAKKAGLLYVDPQGDTLDAHATTSNLEIPQTSLKSHTRSSLNLSWDKRKRNKHMHDEDEDEDE